MEHIPIAGERHTRAIRGSLRINIALMGKPWSEGYPRWEELSTVNHIRTVQQSRTPLSTHGTEARFTSNSGLLHSPRE